jgi:hypothetical protein
MINNVAMKFAASSLILGLTMVGCKPAGEMSRPAALSSHAVKADQQAAKRYAEAEEALRQPLGLAPPPEAGGAAP